MGTRTTLAEKLVDVNDHWFTTKELAETLGITTWGVLKRISRGQIRAHKQGNSWLILKSEFVEDLRNR